MASRKKQTAVSDEEIIAALLNSGSIAQAAQSIGIGPRTIYDRMGTRDFKAAYNAAKGDIIRGAVLTMNRSLSMAVEIVMDIMRDDKSSAATRLQAAKMIIESASKLSDRLRESDTLTAEYADSPFNLDASKW